MSGRLLLLLLEELARAFVEAGSLVILTNTFGAAKTDYRTVLTTRVRRSEVI